MKNQSKVITIVEFILLLLVIFTSIVVIIVSGENICDKSLNSAQWIYTIFFGMYYTVTISRTQNLDLFNTPSLRSGCRYPNSRWRFLASLVFMNILPLTFFWFSLRRLSSVEIINFWNLLVIFTQGIIGYGIYRVFFGILCIRDSKGDFIFYDTIYYFPDKVPINIELEKRNYTHSNSWFHIIPGLIWIAISIVLFLCIKDNSMVLPLVNLLGSQ